MTPREYVASSDFALQDDITELVTIPGIAKKEQRIDPFLTSNLPAIFPIGRLRSE